MVPTILDVLVRPNPVLDSSFVTPGSNTYNDDWIPVSDWRVCKDFTYKNLISMYGKAPPASWSTAPSMEMASGYDLEIWGEHTLELFLARFVLPILNGALARVNEVLTLREVFYLAPGSWIGLMDWVLISRNHAEHRRYSGLLPGDTKLSAKWRPGMENSPEERDRYQWSLPLS